MKKLLLSAVLLSLVFIFGCSSQTPLLEFKEQADFASDEWETTGLTEEYVVQAEAIINDVNEKPFVSIEFNEEGAILFAEITERNIEKSIGIFFKGELISAAIIRDKITGGEALIMTKTIEEAEDIASEINQAI